MAFEHRRDVSVAECVAMAGNKTAVAALTADTDAGEEFTRLYLRGEPLGAAEVSQAATDLVALAHLIIGRDH